MARQHTIASVHLWGKSVGAVAWDEKTGMGEFEFQPSFLKNDWDVAPIKMSLAEARRGRLFSFPELRNSTTFKGLPGLLADVLPDRFGNQLINAWLARQGRAPNSMNPIEMLCFIGKRGMGALSFEPVDPKGPNTATKLELDSLVGVARQILSGRQHFSANIRDDEEKALSDILKIGTSAGGARAKAVIAFNPLTGEVKSGQTDAPKGFTHWLIKLDGVADTQLGVSHGYGRVEMAYHNMATASEIEMTECRLLEENGRAHFMTRRFDRAPGEGKLHVQSFCAMMHYDFNDIDAFSYEQLFQTIRLLKLPYPQWEQMYRRMVFNVMARNCDDHTKNFAFVMDQSGTWRLSPAFDVCYAYRPGSAWVSRQSLSVNGKREHITRQDLITVAKANGIKKPELIINKIRDVVKKWNHFAEAQKVPSDLRAAIHQTLMPL
ncbi:MAG: type II toxin-antitoxin system HipA family toxin [Chitinophagales bacterium]